MFPVRGTGVETLPYIHPQPFAHRTRLFWLPGLKYHKRTNSLSISSFAWHISRLHYCKAKGVNATEATLLQVHRHWSGSRSELQSTRADRLEFKFDSFSGQKPGVEVQTTAASVSVYRFVCHPSMAYICSTIVYVSSLLILSALQLD